MDANSGSSCSSTEGMSMGSVAVMMEAPTTTTTTTTMTEENNNNNNSNYPHQVLVKHDLEVSKNCLKAAEESKIQYEFKINQLQKELEQAKHSLQVVNQQIIQYNESIFQNELKVTCSWNTMYHKLIDYKAKHGHLLVPHTNKTNKELHSLGRFVGNQRTYYKYYMNGDTKHIKQHRIEALNRIGFIWNVVEYQWQCKLQELITYKLHHNGNLHVPNPYIPNKKLGIWVAKQREEWYKYQRKDPSYLTPEHVQALNEIGFMNNNHHHPNNNNNNTTTTTETTNGDNTNDDDSNNHNDEDNDDTDGNKNEPQQSQKRRKKRKRPPNSSSESYRQALDMDIPYSELTPRAKAFRTARSTPDEKWYIRYQELVNFRNEYGHVLVNKRTGINKTSKSSTTCTVSQLSIWCGHQRRQHQLLMDGKESFMTQERITLLEKIGFEFRQPSNVPRKSGAGSSSNNNTTAIEKRARQTTAKTKTQQQQQQQQPPQVQQQQQQQQSDEEPEVVVERVEVGEL